MVRGQTGLQISLTDLRQLVSERNINKYYYLRQSSYLHLATSTELPDAEVRICDKKCLYLCLFYYLQTTKHLGPTRGKKLQNHERFCFMKEAIY
jgi:hypothetical protein